MRPVTDELLIGIAGVTATVAGLFLVGVFFFVEAALRVTAGQHRTPPKGYLRSGTRIVFILFGMALVLSLALAAFTIGWARAVFVAFSVLLVAANVETAIGVRSVSRATGSRTLLINEIAGTVGVVGIVALPWILGGLRPDRADLTLSALLALATGLFSISALALSAFDVTPTPPAPVAAPADQDAAVPAEREQPSASADAP